MGKCQDLLEAARNGNTTVVSKILQHKGGPLSSFRRSPSINWQDVNGYTALHHACLNGHYEIVKVLLAHHAAHEIPDIRGSSPLYLAAWAGNEHIVNLLLMLRGTGNLDAQTIENETALHCAAQHGHNAVVSALLARGADPTIRNNSFQTPLDLAAQFGRLEVVQTLISKHPELIEPYRLYEEVVAVENGRSPPYKITPTKHIFTQSCLHLAARNGHNEVVKTLLAAGVDVNILTHTGSALHEAALCGKKNVVCTLLSAGIDLYAVDGNGKTALDILKDYPTNVTYEILTIINDFWQTNSSMINKNHFRPIKDVNDNHATMSAEISASQEMDVNQTPHFETQHQRSLTINSLDRYNNSTERYTPMEPIKWTKSNIDLSTKHEQTPEYKSVYKSHLQHRRLGGIEKQFPKFSTINELQNQSPLKSTLYRCVDEYVEMTMPNSSACSTPRTPRTPVSTPQPLPSPRKCMEYGDYANINIINAHSKHEHHNNEISLRSGSFDSNNNNDIQTAHEHSPTPDCPPPSASEAESTIFEFVKPAERTMKRKSLLLHQQDSQFYDGLKSFIWEDQTEPQEEQFDSLTSSRVSECVEEFVGDVPFAGLFKGSSLNLANTSSSLDLRNSVVIDDIPSGLRSPSLVRSVKPIPTKRNVTIKTPTSEDEYEFDATKAWDEINNIFESIGNEVAATDTKLEDLSEQNALTNTLRKKTLTIRKPADLLLGSNTQEQNTNPNWCHSANTLIYGYVLYNVFYLGSTVIRELHGTASTRKSIQKLKREETPAPQEDNEENGLINDINSSTRILKATNQQTRLEVGIAMSHAGVRFIEMENKSTICVHDIENINCVSQDTDDLRYFAYITRENDIHYCHVFMVDDLNLATEIILTLGQAFEVAYQLSLIGQEDSLRTHSQCSTPQELKGEKRLSYVDVVDNI
ncbi:ankyrin repeat and sterile alpha motif domain-containing protein 1B isoform X2 [Lucilia sericata]|uniref:ankyrin repeat and sterile alpha motif domain-containing protein 1B isoform X2 n=1 Tax=Lucilia sericata TaxID=13632 RepID=UPI0018A81F96|nr:ankyrin repeat and sterile alpha motif domain-containing protein 1B isoform X2 [Lucilia sericata]XP_037807455.1 ankyrin repeat and sterile alpha motif domain-containing protein 1B isoform X2 [Lucilia sericata]